MSTNLAINRLDPINDARMFAESFAWLKDSPTWRQHTEDVFGTLNAAAYMDARLDERRLDIAVFSGQDYVAKVTLHLTAKNTYEVSLEARRRANPAIIVEAGRLIRDQLFGLYNAELVYAWVPRWARGVKQILESVGFGPDHVIMARGTARGRLIEWERYSLRKADVQ